MAGLLGSFLNWLAARRDRTKGWVDVNPLGFSSHHWRETKSMRWDEVDQIDAGRKPTGFVEIFYVVLFSGRDSIVVDDLDAGFSEFQTMILENWPELESELTRIFTGPPDVAEYAVLWKRGEFR